MPKLPSHSQVLMLVGDTIARDRRTGIHRVAIETARAMAASDDFALVRWDAVAGALRFLDVFELDRMFGAGAWPASLARPESRRVGRPFHELLDAPEDSWLLIPEVGWPAPHGVEILSRALAHCHGWGGRGAFIFYDLIPVTNAAYAEYGPAHESYLRELARADLILPISRTSSDALVEHWRSRGAEGMPPIEPVLLPDGGFGRVERPDPGRPIKKQVVLTGTIEPRKRQVEFLKAMEAARRRNPAVAEWTAVAIGSVHGGVAAEFNALVDRNPWLTHPEYVSDVDYAALVRGAGFTAFASSDEGYGLPISESLALGTPCLCADFGSMAEIAAGGGCRGVDVRDPAALEAAITELCSDPAVILGLRHQIAGRSFEGWDVYASRLRQRMDAAPRAQPAEVRAARAEEDFERKAQADAVGFPDAAAQAAFIAEAAERHWPGLLPSRLVVGDPAGAASVVARQRQARARTAERERFYQQVSGCARDGQAARPVFLRILISTFNRRDFVVMNVKWILAKVLRVADVPVELVVVDGGSTDGTVEKLLEIRDHRLTVVESPVNVGMLAGLREAARLPGAEYVWLVGDDDFIWPQAFSEVLGALRRRRGLSFAFTNFGVYRRFELGELDRPSNLIVEAVPVGQEVAPSGFMKVRQCAEQTDNLFTAIYAIVWRADLLSAAYQHAFDGPPFHNLTEAIPCTEYILGRYGEAEAYWHAGLGVIGNANNSWSRHRPRWHGAVMPQAFALARDAGVDPTLLQNWAEDHFRFLGEAIDIARAHGFAPGLTDEDRPLALATFRRPPPGFDTPG